MRRVNPDTLEIEIVPPKEVGKQFVYVLTEDGCWDYEETLTVEVYSTFEKALEKFHKKVADCKETMKEYSSYEVKDEVSVNRTIQHAYYSTWEDGDSTRLNCEIRINREEVM